MSKESKNVEVLFEDQQNINTFNRLNQRLHEIEAEIKANQTSLEDFEDAENELMLADEEHVRYVVGGCFFHLPLEEGQERLAADADDVRSSVGSLNEELSDVKAKMGELKKALYGKFGSAINLEE